MRKSSKPNITKVVKVNLVWHADGRNIDDTLYMPELSYADFVTMKGHIEHAWSISHETSNVVTLRRVKELVERLVERESIGCNLCSPAGDGPQFVAYNWDDMYGHLGEHFRTSQHLDNSSDTAVMDVIKAFGPEAMQFFDMMIIMHDGSREFNAYVDMHMSDSDYESFISHVLMIRGKESSK